MMMSLIPLLALAVLATGIGCVYVRHEARKLFVELQELEAERDRLQIEWGKLRIEQGTWASHGRVENMARSELNMVEPKPDSVMAIR
ncbi:MAG: cell division protein FtsL [Pseudomonadota bacterium]